MKETAKVYKRRKSSSLLEAAPDEALQIGKVLEEARLEICSLEQNNNKMETALHDLHLWLAGGETTGSDVTDQHPVVNVSAAMQTSMQSDDVSVLKCENASLKLQLGKLKEIAEVARSSLTQNGEEGKSTRESLKNRLSSSSFICKQTHDNDLNVTSRRKADSKKHDESESSILDSSNVDEIQRQLCDVLEKNVRWQNYNHERELYVGNLLSKYKDVCKKLQDTRENLAQITSNPDKLAVEQRRHYDNVIFEARQELENQRSVTLHAQAELNVIKSKMAEDTKQLKTEVEYWRRRYEEQRSSLAAMSANYESERRRSNNSLKENKEKQSQIQLLQNQVQLFSEDFRAERKEKEICEAEILVFKKQIEELKQKVEILKQKPPQVSFSDVVYCHDNDPYDVIEPQVRGRRAVSPPKPFPRRRDKTPTDVTSIEFSNVQNKARRPTPAPPGGRKIRETRSQVVAIDSSRVKKESRRLKETPSKKVSRKRTTDDVTDSQLHCPCCNRVYDVTDHLELLKHIDVCGD